MANPPHPPEPKFAKLSGEGKLKVDAFLTVFANTFSVYTDAKIITKLASFSEGEAFEFYASDICPSKNAIPLQIWSQRVASDESRHSTSTQQI